MIDHSVSRAGRTGPEVDYSVIYDARQVRPELGGRHWLAVDLVVRWTVWCGVSRMEFCGLILIFDLIFFF